MLLHAILSTVRAVCITGQLQECITTRFQMQQADSLLTINLTINNSTYDTMDVTACESYDSPSGLYNWTTSGMYYDTIPNMIGCDSLLTINLTVNYITSDSIVLTECDS